MAALAPADTCAAVLWAMFATSLGYFGGRAFESPWQAIALSLGLALLVAAASEAFRIRSYGQAASAFP